MATDTGRVERCPRSVEFSSAECYRHTMQPVSHQTLGVTIAYILPGFLSLWGLSFLSPTIQAWLDVKPGAAPTVGGFLFVLLASLGLGMFPNFLRNLVIDPL